MSDIEDEARTEAEKRWMPDEDVPSSFWLRAAAEAERDRLRQAIEKELAQHTEKHGETPRYAPGGYVRTHEPTHWEPYVICNACGTDYPCRTRQTLSAALEEQS